MQTPVSIIISGKTTRCRQIAIACATAGIHPTLLLTDTSTINDPGLDEFQYTTDPFSCVGDMVIDCSEDDPDMIISRCNQLAEINHSDVVIAIMGALSNPDDTAARIMYPGRVVIIKGSIDAATDIEIISTRHTSDATYLITSRFIQSLQTGTNVAGSRL